MTVPGAADTVTTLLQNASDLLAASLDSVSARLAQITAAHPAHFLLLPPPPEGTDFDPAAVRHRIAHSALCLAEMLFFIFAIAFFKRFFNLEIIVGFRRGGVAGGDAEQRNLLLEEVENTNRRNSLLPKAVKSDDEDEDRNDGSTAPAAPTDESSGIPEDARHLDRFETSKGNRNCSPKGRTRSASVPSLSSSSSMLSDVSSLSSHSESENEEELEENEAENDEDEEGASTVPTSDDRQSTDNAVLTFDSNHLAASSQYDRSDCGDEDEDEEPTSFFDNDDDGDDVPRQQGATKKPPRSESGLRAHAYDDTGEDDPIVVTECESEGSHTNKRKRTVVFPDDGFRSPSREDCCSESSGRGADCERLPAIRDSSFDSELSWFQEHYGQVWNAEDCESDSVASSSSSR